MTALSSAGRGEGVRALDGAILRIFGEDGEPVGAGFLITDELALTCAHVVTAALGLPEGTGPGALSRVRADLPLLPGSGQVTATVERLLPAQEPQAGDVAVLRVDQTVHGARPVRLLESQERDLWEDTARAFGFPAGRPDGEWHRGVLRARQASGRVQLDLADANGYRVTFGFSGSPVWDDALGGVVGMTVTAEPVGPAVSCLIPTDRLLAEWPDLRMQLFLAASPFRGLEAFGEADAPVFCGREAESAQLAATVAGGRWTTLVGPSGCGKSSLVMAGVVPRLRAEGYCPVVIRPSAGSSPLAALAGELLPLLEPQGDVVRRLERIDALAGILAEPGRLADIADQVSARHGGARLLIVVDQLEELFARTAAEVGKLAGVLFDGDVPGSVRVLVTLRADFLETALATPCLGNAFSRPAEILQPMGPGQLRESITGPVAMVPGVEYQEGLADRILSDAGTDPGALPLLQFTLDELWRSQSAGQLTHAAYDKLGRVHGALKRHIDTEWTRYVKGEGYDEAAARGLLTKLVRVPIGSVAAARRTALHTEMSHGEWDAAQHLAASRLLVTGRSPEGTETVELAHEAVITAWDDLAAWVQADRTFLEWRESLHHDMARWERGQRNPDLLPSAAALAGADGREDALEAAERDYIMLGRARRRARTRRRRSLTALFSVLILAASGAGLVSVRAQQDAAQRAAVVRSGVLAADSQALTDSDPGLAAQFAVAAYRTAPTRDAANALYAALQSPLLDNTLATVNGYADRVASQTDGPLGAAIDSTGTVRVWNLDTPTAPILASKLHTAHATGIALSPRAPLLAASCTTPGLCLWNLTDPARPAVEARLPTPASFRGNGKVDSMAISPDGTLLAAASESGFTLVWSLAGPAHPRLLAMLPNPAKDRKAWLASVAFAPGGRLLAESIEHGATRLWSLANPAAPASLATINVGYQAITINPAGTTLVGVNDASLGLWTISRPAAPRPVKYAGTGAVGVDVQALSISPDGRTLAYGGTGVTDGNAGLCLLDLASVALNPDTGPLCMSTGFSTLTMAYTSRGTLLTGGLDSTVRLWRASPAVIPGANGFSSTLPLAVSGNGRRMAAAISPTDAGAASPVGIWDLGAPAGPALEATLPPSSAVGATFVDDNVVLTITTDGRVQLWNIADPRHPRQTASLGTVSSATFSLYNISFNPAHGIVAVLDDGGVLNLWHVTSAGTATLAGSLRDPAAAGNIGGILTTGNTAYMLTPVGIDWWNTRDPAHPAETGSSPLHKANVGESEGSATTLFAAASEPDPSGGGATLNLYDLGNGRARSTATVSRHIGSVLGLSTDGHRLAANDLASNVLTIWDTTNPRAPKLTAPAITAFDIFGVAFSDNDDLMTDWNIQTVQLWDTKDPGAPVLEGSFSPVSDSLGTNLNEGISAAAFTPSGKLLITVQAAGPSLAYLLNPDVQQAVDQVCSITTIPITAAQWGQYAPGIPYQNPCRS